MSEQEFKVGKTQQLLESLYGDNAGWIHPNIGVFHSAWKAQLMVGGSVAMAIHSKGSSGYRTEPGDIDFVTNSMEGAMKFVAYLQERLKSKEVYYRVLINNNTGFCPGSVTTHIRIDVPFWKPICVFVRSDETKHYRVAGGLKVQLYGYVKEAAEELETIDGKARVDDDFEPKEERTDGCYGYE